MLFLYEQYDDGLFLKSLLETTQKIKVRPQASAPWRYSAMRARENCTQGSEDRGAELEYLNAANLCPGCSVLRSPLSQIITRTLSRIGK